MMILSATGVFRMILMLIGGFVLIRFLGQLMNAKKNMEEESRLNRESREFQEEKQKAVKTFGKTRVLKDENDVQGDVQDVTHEEVK